MKHFYGITASTGTYLVLMKTNMVMHSDTKVQLCQCENAMRAWWPRVGGPWGAWWEVGLERQGGLPTQVLRHAKDFGEPGIMLR